ncbi:hypothetical protein RJ639_032462 [Escallonia herrerae]|uniref:BAG domain-containing protein n=1 Tax=Escallonia herrerae TaxID=1293975 RepID=A0AA88WV29_9ASTE|nr:hypothetical protein RJ639_032462 [Escallonia herrerae]
MVGKRGEASELEVCGDFLVMTDPAQLVECLVFNLLIIGSSPEVNGWHSGELLLVEDQEVRVRVRVNKTLMALLFKLDSVQGVDLGVRDLRKGVIKKAIALQVLRRY